MAPSWDPVTGAARTAVQKMAAAAARTFRVLIVDDAEDLRLMLRIALDRQEGFTVVAEAPDGATAVAAAATHQPDVILLDIAMPVMDGLQALPLLREQCPRAVVVMLSGFGVTSEAAIQALRLGAHGYIEKVGSMTRLTRQLRDILRTGGETAPSIAPESTS